MRYAQVERHYPEASDELEHDTNRVFAAETIVDASEVVIVVGENENDELAIAKRRMKVGLVAVVLIAVSVIAIGLRTIRKSATAAGVSETTFDPSFASTNVPTVAPTASTFPEIVQTLLPVSGDLLMQEGTSANMALDWIAHRDAVGRDSSDPRFIQRYVMAVFYFATRGDKWREGGKVCQNGKNFLGESDECEWFGNYCRDGQIFEINHGTSIGNNLIGTLPHELAWLPELQSLFVQNNHLRGTIPTEYGRLSKFHTLVASNNLLGSPFPESILDGGLMEVIEIEKNKFTGQFPSNITSQLNLTRLVAFDNEFTGTITPDFWRLAMLEALELGQNHFTGTIPEAIASLLSLESFLVNENHLSGLFPTSIFSMRRLVKLNVTGNNFTGTMPSEIGSLGSGFDARHRKYVNLANNSFHGAVPPEVANIMNLNELTLHGNDFVGTMPSAVCALKTGQRKQSYSLTLLTSDCADVDCSCSEACTCY